jgi:hypothetical protein
MIRWGAVLLVGSWVPIVLVGTFSPDANPIGLGLLAWAGSAVALYQRPGQLTAFAQSRVAIEAIVPGVPVSQFQASQQVSTISS